MKQIVRPLITALPRGSYVLVGILMETLDSLIVNLILGTEEPENNNLVISLILSTQVT